jgi:hypothetical protein
LRGAEDALWLTFLLILLGAGTGIWWERTGKFLTACVDSGRSSEECWEILR